MAFEGPGTIGPHLAEAAMQWRTAGSGFLEPRGMAPARGRKPRTAVAGRRSRRSRSSVRHALSSPRMGRPHLTGKARVMVAGSHKPGQTLSAACRLNPNTGATWCSPQSRPTPQGDASHHSLEHCSSSPAAWQITGIRTGSITTCELRPTTALGAPILTPGRGGGRGRPHDPHSADDLAAPPRRERFVAMRGRSGRERR